MLAIDAANGVHLVHALLLVVRLQLLVDLGALDQRLEHVQHGVDGPHVLLDGVIDQANVGSVLLLQLQNNFNFITN